MRKQNAPKKGELDQLRVDEKGNFGEIKMHEHYEKNGHLPYIIGEAKYGRGSLSTLADGVTQQMSTKWIN